MSSNILSRESMGKAHKKTSLAVIPFIALAALILISTPAFSQILGEGGSNYIAFGIPPSISEPGGNWRDSSVFKTPACQLDRGKAIVVQELQRMRNSGQRKIALVLWFMHQSSDAVCTGFALNSASGRLDATVVDNLRSFIKIAQSLGFDEVEIRFAPLVRNSPREWTRWNNTMFQEDWRVVDQVRTALTGPYSLKVTYDLGVELGGIEEEHCTQCSLYTKALWQLYTTHFGSNDTYGFSIAYRKGRLERLISVLRAGGYPQPSAYAIDIYSNIYRGIMEFSREAYQNEISHPRFFIQETNYNDHDTLEQLMHSTRDCRCSIVGVMQWPLMRGAPPKTLVPLEDEFDYGSSPQSH